MEIRSTRGVKSLITKPNRPASEIFDTTHARRGRVGAPVDWDAAKTPKALVVRGCEADAAANGDGLP